MPSAIDEQMDANIDLLLKMHFDPTFDKTTFDAQVTKIKANYEVAQKQAGQDDKYKNVADSIAKSLPTLVKGTYAAIKAFESGDSISGAAAIMDICASILPVFTAIASAAGPVGTLVGALFSVVGQILSFFAPKQPSMEDKIQKMLNQLQTETQKANAKAFGKSVSSYTSSMRTKCSGIHKMSKPEKVAGVVRLTVGKKEVAGVDTKFLSTTAVGRWLIFDLDATGTAYKIAVIVSDTSLTLSTPYGGAASGDSSIKSSVRSTVRRSIEEIMGMPLNTEDEADAFMVEMRTLEWGLERDNEKLDTPVFANWQIAGYLETTESQSKEGWPEVLGVWCQTYIDLLSANMMLPCLADPKTLDMRIKETQQTNKDSVLPSGARTKCHSAFIKLKALTIALQRAWESDTKEMLKVVKNIRPVAQERGLYAHLGYWNNGLILYVGAGNGKTDNIGWDYKKNTVWMKSFSIFMPEAQEDSFAPKYELISLEEGGSVHRTTVDSITGHLPDGTGVINRRDGEYFWDVSGMALHEGHNGIDFSTKPLSFISLAVVKNNTYNYLNFYTLDKDSKSTRVNYEPHMGGMRNVRSIYLPAMPLTDDPDAGALRDDTNPKMPGSLLLNSKNHITYGGVHDRNQVWVVAWNAWETVEGPAGWGKYSGIEVDPYYLWIYGEKGIACATHASVVKARQGKIARPAWITHTTKSDKKYTTDPVTAFCPCVDGTLIAHIGNEIHTAHYKIENEPRQIVTSSWKARGGNAKQVIKMPIPCWKVFESLRENLERE
jgi:hypothetical protein